MNICDNCNKEPALKTTTRIKIGKNSFIVIMLEGPGDICEKCMLDSIRCYYENKEDKKIQKPEKKSFVDKAMERVYKQMKKRD